MNGLTRGTRVSYRFLGAIRTGTITECRCGRLGTYYVITSDLGASDKVTPRQIIRIY